MLSGYYHGICLIMIFKIESVQDCLKCLTMMSEVCSTISSVTIEFGAFLLGERFASN